MRIALLTPAGAMHRFKGSFKKSLHYAPLTMTTLAALIPARLEADVELYDETTGIIPPDLEADMIGITAMTGTFPRACRWAEHFRKKGIPVVMGGVHPSLRPDEALQFADSVVVGFAEKTWPRLLLDFSRGKMEKIYQNDEEVDLAGRPTPKRELLRKGAFITTNTLEATRGCLHRCRFCAASAFCGGNYYTRPPKEVAAEAEALPGKDILFVDVNLIADPQYAKSLFRELAPLKKRWYGLATSNVTEDKELFDLIVKSGCRGLLVGFESVAPSSLKSMDKGFNRIEKYREMMKKVHDAGISVMGTFAFGADNENNDVFKQTVETVIDLKIDLPRYSLVTPFPGTPFYDKLEREGRIIERDWSLYDVEHCVFKPKNLTPDELEKGLEYAWKTTYSIPSIIKRTLLMRPIFMVNFATNLGYKVYADKLHRYSKGVMTDLTDVPL